MFNAVLVQGSSKCRKGWTSRNAPKRDTQTCFEAAAQEVLSFDFLGPTVAAVMYPDLVQKVVAPAFLPSRATALETSWEGAWDRTFPENPGRLARPFLDLWKSAEPNWLPALFLNGTHQESGKRLIASNLKVTPDIFIDAADIYSKVDGEGGEPIFLFGDMPASTAAHNSARFSYVSPAGTLRTGGHVIDGGYFENYGAQTISELLEGVDEQIEETSGAKQVKRPIVLIQISNDTELADRLTVNGPAGSNVNATVLSPHSQTSPDESLRSKGIRKASSTFNEVTAPILGLLNTRTARGVLAAKNLGDWARWLREHNRPSMYLHFRLFKAETEPLALGWVLSEASEHSMQNQLRSGTNLKNFAKLLCALGSDPTSIAESLPLPPNDAHASSICEDLGKP